ncbi:flagellar biosynthetic protein FliO [Bartonella machadoae]|uniref:flagellar biosynthetic protein FliO n=1 Tax=Bartonella machadoae TaxID=2893471 RepID=UPI001F4CDA5E|nr:flagellar biosynthetic protein FliO [Bartonella machadoae]UNE55229.1 flagellar biosynthetic protein FliO [Bartonella machadoae]
MYVWLSSQIGTSAANITISFIFFIITITAIAAIILFLRRFKRGKSIFNRKKSLSRLTLCETIAIDRTRRLVLIRCDDKEHLLLIGGVTDIVVESNITNTSLIQKSETPSTLITTRTNSPLDLSEEKSVSVKREQIKEKASNPFTNQNVEDSAITAEIEGRQEPSLFIPPLKK